MMTENTPKPDFINNTCEDGPITIYHKGQFLVSLGGYQLLQAKIEELERKQKIDDARIKADNDIWKLQVKTITDQNKKIEELEEVVDFRVREVSRLKTRLTERIALESSLTAHKELIEKVKEKLLDYIDWGEDHFIGDSLQAIEYFEKKEKS